MPELPEVETVCRGLSVVLEGRQLVRLELRRKDLRIPFPKGLMAAATGARVDKIHRRAKYILMDLDNGNVLIAHLGMAGRMVVAKKNAPLEKHDHVVFVTDDGTEVRFNDPRRFGLLTYAAVTDVDSHKLFRHLGPDPLGNRFNSAALSAALKGRKTSIKAALLDQRIVVGVGNIYACESLYRAKISPKRKAGTVAGERAERLVPAIRTVLNEAIASGGSSLRDHVQPSGELGAFQHKWQVYGRAGKPCRVHADTLIKRIVQGGRSTFFCPRCQT